MKCQRCSKPATIHITEIVDGQILELHLCEEHAQKQLSGEQESEQESVGAKAMAKLAKVQGKISSELDSQCCPVCGISFRDFRNNGRLGCPNDYEVFAKELIPLLENIHSDTQHCGKTPKRAPADSKKHTQLIQLRQNLRQAVADERYEEAADIRDRIQSLESGDGETTDDD